MTATDAGQLYLRRALEQMPRSISLQDRERLSETYGCFDRTYWAWKFVDFPGARYQEGVYALAFVYAVEDGGQGYLGNSKVLAWIEAGLNYWARIQYRDGSFDEAYPFEHSLAATAFTAFYIAEALRLVEGDLSAETRGRAREALIRAGSWLCHNDETHGVLSNHLAAAAAGLVHIGELTGESRFVDRSRYFLERILRHQSVEGWYEEYGGADPGYQSHATFYLARSWELTGDKALGASLDRSVEFLRHFVHADDTMGGEYGSRGTQFVYPAGFEMLAGRCEGAGFMASRLAEAIERRRVAALETMDAQNFYPLLNNYLFAARAAVKRAELPAPEGSRDERTMVSFPDAGLIKVVRPAYEMYVATSKGGVFKVFDRKANRLISSDCGYVGRLKGGRLVVSQTLDRTRRAEVADDRIVVEAPFFAIKRTVFRPLSFLAFRAINLTLGRVAGLARWLKGLLVTVLIYRRKGVPLTLRRTIVLGEEGVEVIDQLRASSGVRLERLGLEDVFSTVHMGSSRYFQPNELGLVACGDGDGMSVPLAELRRGVEIRRRISPQPG